MIYWTYILYFILLCVHCPLEVDSAAHCVTSLWNHPVSLFTKIITQKANRWLLNHRECTLSISDRETAQRRLKAKIRNSLSIADVTERLILFRWYLHEKRQRLLKTYHIVEAKSSYKSKSNIYWAHTDQQNMLFFCLITTDKTAQLITMSYNTVFLQTTKYHYVSMGLIMYNIC